MNVELIHIAQMHRYLFANLDDLQIPAHKKQDLLDRVALSQLKVAQTIKKYPGYPVVVEGLAFNMNLSKVRGNEQARLRNIFPQGFPNTFDALNDIQKTTLYTEGAAYILFTLGETPRLYRASNFNGDVAKASHQLAEPLDLNDSEAVTNRYKKIKGLAIPREEEAIECAIEALLLNHLEKTKMSTESDLLLETRVLLVYGADHDFTRYSGKKYSKTLQEQVDIAVEVIDCRASSARNMNNLFSTKAWLIGVVIGAALFSGTCIALMLTGVFAPFGAGLMGLGITAVVSAVIGAGLGGGFYMIGKKLKSCFDGVGENDVLPMSLESSLQGLSGQRSSYANASTILSSKNNNSTLPVSDKNNTDVNDNAQANLSIGVNQLIGECLPNDAIHLNPSM